MILSAVIYDCFDHVDAVINLGDRYFMIDRSYFEKIGRLRLAVHKKSSSVMQGARKSAAKGSSAEFSDFREYMQGDDIRRIDWNAYGRTERLFVKEYVEERESNINILLDTSASMDFGEPSKSELAGEIAAALGYIGLSGNDHVYIYDSQRVDRPLSISGGVKGFRRVRDFLDTRSFEGSTDIYATIRKMKLRGSGITIIISDFWDEAFVTDENREENLERLFKYLEYTKQQVILIHTLDPSEKDPTLEGTHNLIDMEDEASRIRVTMDAKTVDDYRGAFRDFCKNIEKKAKKYHAFYRCTYTDESMDRIVFEDLREIYDI